MLILPHARCFQITTLLKQTYNYDSPMPTKLPFHKIKFHFPNSTQDVINLISDIKFYFIKIRKVFLQKPFNSF